MNSIARQLQSRVDFFHSLRHPFYAFFKFPSYFFKLKRYQALINQSLKAHKTFETSANLFWGEKMTVIVPEKVSIFLLKYGFFEEGLTAMMLKYLKPAMTVLDVGAHYGYFTCLASYLVGARGSVHSFEPSRHNFEILKKNTNGKENIFLNQIAIFSKSGKLKFFDFCAEYSASNTVSSQRAHNLIKQEKLSAQDVRVQSVPAISLDEYVYQKSLKPDFIKIDAECAEPEIIIGMKNILKEFQPIISIEVGDGIGKVKCQEIVSSMITSNYQPWEYRGGQIIKHQLQKDYVYDNLLFVPN